VNEGEKSRVIVLSTKLDEKSAQATELEEAKATAAAAAAATAEAPHLERGTKKPERSAMPWVLVGVGGVVTVVGGVFVLISMSDRSSAKDLEELSARQPDAASAQSTQASAHAKKKSADSNLKLGLIVGGAGVGVLAV